MRKMFFLLALLGMLVFFSGCSRSYVAGLYPQSHFDFPNSNVVPVGKAVGEASRTKFLGTPMVTSDLMDEAVQNALQSRGGDILINYIATANRSEFLGFHTLSYKVEGTACKTDIGTQMLR